MVATTTSVSIPLTPNGSPPELRNGGSPRSHRFGSARQTFDHRMDGASKPASEAAHMLRRRSSIVENDLYNGRQSYHLSSISMGSMPTLSGLGDTARTSRSRLRSTRALYQIILGILCIFVLIVAATRSEIASSFTSLGSRTSAWLHSPIAHRIRYERYDFSTLQAGGRNSRMSLADFLKDRMGPPDPSLPLWVTMSGGIYITEAIPHLRIVLERLANGTMPHSKPRSDGRKDPVVTPVPRQGRGTQPFMVLCLDEQCMEQCRIQGYMAYFYDNHVGSKHYTDIGYQKSRMMYEVASAGYATLFIDGDVYLRNDPFEFMLPVDDASVDIQIQDDVSNGDQLNIGFLLQSANERVAALWLEVLDKVKDGASWDQEWFSAFANVTAARKVPGHHERFTSPQGVNFYVLDRRRFSPYHITAPAAPFPEAVLMHLTCADNAWLKFYLSAVYGYWQNVNGYYTRPPQIITMPEISGTKVQVRRQIRMLIQLAQITGRAIQPPLVVTIFSADLTPEWPKWGDRIQALPEPVPQRASTEPMELSVHRRHWWSTVHVQEVRNTFNVTVLEPNYIAHALTHKQSTKTVFALTSPGNLDLFWYRGRFDLLTEAITSDHYMQQQVISITDPTRSLATLPVRGKELRLCSRLEMGYQCYNLCQNEQGTYADVQRGDHDDLVAILSQPRTVKRASFAANQQETSSRLGIDTSEGDLDPLAAFTSLASPATAPSTRHMDVSSRLSQYDFAPASSMSTASGSHSFPLMPASTASVSMAQSAASASSSSPSPPASHSSLLYSSLGMSSGPSHQGSSPPSSAEEVEPVASEPAAKRQKTVATLSMDPSKVALAISRPHQTTAVNLKTLSYAGLVQYDQSRASLPSQFDLVNLKASTSQGSKRKLAASSNGDEEDNSGDENSADKDLGGHNAVERRYRDGINTSIALLRDLVPATAHLRAEPSSETKAKGKRNSQFMLPHPAPVTQGVVDGVEAATKLGKKVVLSKSIDYIRFLKGRREELEEELFLLRQFVVDCVEGGGDVLASFDDQIKTVREQARPAASQVANAGKSKAKLSRSQRAKATPKSKGSSVTPPQAEATQPRPTTMDENVEDVMVAPVSMDYLSEIADLQDYASILRDSGMGGYSDGYAHAADSATFDDLSPTTRPGSAAMFAVLGGVSFLGGFGYDVAYTANAAPNSERAWSSGLRRRSVPVTDDTLSPLQSAILAQPAILSGVICVSLLVIVLLALRLVLRLGRRLSADSTIRYRLALQRLHTARTGDVKTVVGALRIVADAPKNLPSALMSIVRQAWRVITRTHSLNAPRHVAIEACMATLRLAEIEVMSAGTGQRKVWRFQAYLQLLNASRSAAWQECARDHEELQEPRVQATLALLALTSPLLQTAQAQSHWTEAISSLKKVELPVPWLSMVLESSLVDAHASLDELRTSSDPLVNPLAALADLRCEAILIDAWMHMFAAVARADTLRIELDNGSDLVDWIDVAAESTRHGSAMHHLALLTKGVWVCLQQPQLSDDLASFIASLDTGESVASIAAFLQLAEGADDIESIGSPVNAVDNIAFVTLSWLHLRRLQKRADQFDSSLSSAVHDHTVALRALCAHAPFIPSADSVEDIEVDSSSESGSEDASDFALSSKTSDDFTQAVDTCLEDLYMLGRRAALGEIVVT
ncbi:uncharacterized protein L969DRAFT_74430 [Mixia osmundae IAM 14324]|uniref:BHLH domain-containing protein n=1 Tax=Mixia osmundae (strain CBS 9802 / IAM 14324 / JCM 22182 / KY 12970) TaxID=764103 RepID=G7E3F6_MIXOS|nr:uncharacterized protein L969DRAFT_74430 [Mixia osmundae IAM 14324]KEI39352.1 hypothetical protein L969DRAFT_74430 [Mixia osmundae IAM 14324]GAA97366.1 hypothetical protein E5Q_04044 [Mixia osmundae IAM 14324]